MCTYDARRTGVNRTSNYFPFFSCVACPLSDDVLAVCVTFSSIFFDVPPLPRQPQSSARPRSDLWNRISCPAIGQHTLALVSPRGVACRPLLFSLTAPHCVILTVALHQYHHRRAVVVLTITIRLKHDVAILRAQAVCVFRPRIFKPLTLPSRQGGEDCPQQRLTVSKEYSATVPNDAHQHLQGFVPAPPSTAVLWMSNLLASVI